MKKNLLAFLFCLISLSAMAASPSHSFKSELNSGSGPNLVLSQHTSSFTGIEDISWNPGGF